MTVTIIRGLPGSGKSTLAKKWAEQSGNTVWVEADHYFEAPMGLYRKAYLWDGKWIKDAHKRCHRLAEAALQQGRAIIVSNTFTRLWEMQGYIDMASDYGVHLNVISCQDEFDSVHDVPAEVLVKMKQRWEEYDDESLYYSGHPLLP